MSESRELRDAMEQQRALRVAERERVEGRIVALLAEGLSSRVIRERLHVGSDVVKAVKARGRA